MKTEPCLADQYEILENIEEFGRLDKSRHGKTFTFKVLRQFKDWHYDPASDSFGPRKFIGYRNITIESYRGDGDGGDTNTSLSRHFIRLNSSDPRYKYLEAKLDAFVSGLGAPLSRRFHSAKQPGGIHIPRSHHDVDVAMRPDGRDTPRKIEQVVTQFERDPEVRAWVLTRAKGLCDLCERPAPFETIFGPYLEVHHVCLLAHGGSDTIQNTVALCPNCHRELHHGLHRLARREVLYARISGLIRPPPG